MCISVPGRITQITGGPDFAMATVDVSGTIKECCLIYVPGAAVGDYVIIHAGFAISILDEQEALSSLALFEELGVLKPVTAGSGPATPAPGPQRPVRVWS